jgi:hypothetical protein
MNFNDQKRTILRKDIMKKIIRVEMSGRDLTLHFDDKEIIILYYDNTNTCIADHKRINI